MTNEDYINYLHGTIDSYPLKIKKHIKKLFVEAGIAQDEPQISIENILEDGTDVSELQITEKIKKCLSENKKAIKLFEKWEFEKDFKYSVYFKSNNFLDLITKVSALNSFINTKDIENNNIFDIILNPLRYSTDELIILKFNLKYDVNDPFSSNKLMLKYPVLIVVHKVEEIVELRFDVLKRMFLNDKREQTIYSDLIKDIRNYLTLNMQCTLIPLDLNFLITEAKKDTQNEIRLLAEYKKLPSGGNAQLEVGNNQDFVLPIIGELKELLIKYQSAIDAVPELKVALDQFIFENEELSDYSWIEVLWENDKKTKNIGCKILFNYRNNSYSLVQHYYSNSLIGMERMNHVTRYISSHRTDIETEVVAG